MTTINHNPKRLGPYSDAVRAGGFLFTSGQLGLDPVAGTLVPGGAAAQTAQALVNLKAVLGAAGLTLNDVVKTTVFVTDIAEFAAVNEAYAQGFGEHRPARSCVQVAALPAGALVEIEAVAAIQ